MQSTDESDFYRTWVGPFGTVTVDVASVSSSLVVLEVYDDSGFATKVLTGAPLTDTIETVTYVSTAPVVQSIVWRVTLQSPTSTQSKFLNYNMAITCSSCYSGKQIFRVNNFVLCCIVA